MGSLEEPQRPKGSPQLQAAPTKAPLEAPPVFPRVEAAPPPTPRAPAVLRSCCGPTREPGALPGDRGKLSWLLTPPPPRLPRCPFPLSLPSHVAAVTSTCSPWVVLGAEGEPCRSSPSLPRPPAPLPTCSLALNQSANVFISCPGEGCDEQHLTCVFAGSLEIQRLASGPSMTPARPAGPWRCTGPLSRRQGAQGRLSSVAALGGAASREGAASRGVEASGRGCSFEAGCSFEGAAALRGSAASRGVQL